MGVYRVTLRDGVAEGKVFEVAEIVQEGDKFVQGNRTSVQFEKFESLVSERLRKCGWNRSRMKRQVREFWELLQMRFEESVDVHLILRVALKLNAQLSPAEKRANVFEKLVPFDIQPFL